MYIDVNNSDQFVTGDPHAVTDASGNYQFANLSPDTYTIRVVSQLGWRQTPAANDFGQQVTVTSGQMVTSIGFGETQQGQILGNVFNDANADGVLNSSENNLSGWTVYLDTNNSGTFQISDPTAASDAWGNFTFDNLAQEPIPYALFSSRAGCKQPIREVRFR